MPGTRALAFASRWFDPATVARVFEPLVADWQREWLSAAPSQRAWIRVRGFAAFVIAALVSSPRIVTTAAPPEVVKAIVVRVAGFVAIAAVILAAPLMIDVIDTLPPMSAAVLRLLLAALPSGIVLAFPFSMLLAVDVIRRANHLPPHLARATAVKLAAAAVVFMVIAHGFVMPAANQTYRVLTTRASLLREDPSGELLRRLDWRASPMPGYREQSTLQLISALTAEASTDKYTRGGAIRSELSSRAVLMLMPAVLVWLRWLSHNVRRPRRFWPLPAAAMTVAVVIAFFTTYAIGQLVEAAWHLKPGDGRWLPIVMALLIGGALQWLTARRNIARLEAV